MSHSHQLQLDANQVVNTMKSNQKKNPNNRAAKYFDSNYYKNLPAEKQARLLSILRSGLENSDSEVGCYAMYPTDYQEFYPFLGAVIRDYHKVREDQIHQSNWTIDPKKFELTNIDQSFKYTSIRVRVGRNSKDFPLPGAMTLYHRVMFEHQMVTRVINQLIKNPKFGGRYISLTPGSPFHINDEQYEQLVKEHKMFKDMSHDPYLNSAGISRDWPNGRGMYESSDEKFLMWIGEEDHLRIMYMYKGSNLGSALLNLREFLDVIENGNGVNLMYDQRFGAVTSCPSNLGTGMRFSIHLKLPKLTKNGKDVSEAKKYAKQFGLSLRGAGGEHTDAGEGGLVDVSPSARLMIQEREIIQKLYDGVRTLYNIEKRREQSEDDQPDIVEVPNSLMDDADEYLRKHRILELFEDLCTALCYRQPEENIEQFLVEELRVKQKQGFKTNIFSPDEINNIFQLFDLKKEGFINSDKCRQALSTMANSEQQYKVVHETQIPDKVDNVTFQRLVETVLGIK